MSLNTNQMTAEERKKNREKFMIKDKENETIYRHYGDLNGADFKLRKNKNCEIYILDWSKGMYIDDCEDCKIFCGPIDGSVFIRGSKNCEFSIIARQVRFRNCENLKVFTYCPSDPAVESSFNIYFAPFNAFFPHLKELFVKGEFKKEEKNHIDTPYDFTPGEELGGGAPHHLQLSENEFFIKVINDGDEPVEEMFDGYSQEEPWIKNKSSELPKFGEAPTKNNDNEFNFNENENKNNNPITQPTLNDFIIPSNNNEPKINNNNLMNMDEFLSNNINLSNQNNQNNQNKDNGFDFLNNNNSNDNNNNNNNFMDMNDFFGGNSNTNNNMQNQNVNIDFNSLNNNENNSNNFFNNKMNSFNNNIPNKISKEQEEEMKRQELRNKEREIRQAKIKEKMEKEAKMRMEIMKKASEYMTQFYEERQKKIAMNHEKLMQSNGSQNNNSNNSGSPWGMVQSSFTGSSSGADRMREAIINKNKDQQ
jgi:hypothetical protein